MTRTFYLSFLLLLSSVLPLSAAWGQGNAEILDVRLERLARFEALGLLDEYGLYHLLNDNYSREQFKSLFADDAQHTLDLPMYNQNGVSFPCSIADYMQGYQNIYGNSTSNDVDVDLLFLESDKDGQDILIKAHCLKRFIGKTVQRQASFDDKTFTQHVIIEMRTTNGADKKDQWDNPRDERGRKKPDVELRLSIQQVTWDITQAPYLVSLVETGGTSGLVNKCGGEAIPTADSTLSLFVNRSGQWVFRDNSGSYEDIPHSARRYDVVTPAATVTNPVSLGQSRRRRWSAAVQTGVFGGKTQPIQDNNSNTGNLELKSAPFLQLGAGFATTQDRDDLAEISFGIRATQANQNLSMDQFNSSSMETDPDGFAYERQSSSSNWTESLTEQSLSLHMGYLRLRNKSKSGTPWWLGGSIAAGLSFTNQLDFNAASDVFHQGYYAGLYGITIDENGIYDFGSHRGTGSGMTAWNGIMTVTPSVVLGRQIGTKDSAEKTQWMSSTMLLLSLGGSFQQVWSGAENSSLYQGTAELNSATTQLTSFSLLRPEVSLTFRHRLDWESDVRCDQN
jgi:hypothetical protein